MIKLISRPYWYLVFFATYPVLALLASNIREVEISVFYRSLLACYLFAALVFGVAWLIMREGTKAALISTLVLFVFFTYGHVYEVIRYYYKYLDYLGGPHVALSLLSLVILVVGTRYILRAKDYTYLIQAVTLIGAFLTIYPLVQIGIFYSQKEPAPAAIKTKAPIFQGPDIYYIILDGYSREDTLKALGWDNSGFIKGMQDTGFYVASCSRSNYRMTLLSLGSSLNLDYIYNVIPNNGAADTNVEPVYQALQYNKVRTILKEQGYQIISFKTGYEWDEWRDADKFLHAPLEETPFLYPAIQPFEYLFLQTTALRPFMQNGFLAKARYIEHYNRVNYMLDELPKIASQPGPKFVYAHFLVPHAPFIYLPDGSINPDYNYYITEAGIGVDEQHIRDGYLNNVQYINSKILPVLKQIIANSKQPPIIIVQGDHGYVLEERKYNNLNAYYFPGEAKQSLYPSITPVNTFRLIFDKYFGMTYDLRPDKSIGTDPGHPFRQHASPPFPADCP
jgi:Sulfatase